jgi:hypothetical protein
MASATVDYIGKDSNHQTVVRVKENGEAVGFIRRGMSTPTPAAAPKI